MQKTIRFAVTALLFAVVMDLAAAPLPYLSDTSDRFTFAVPVKKAPVIDGKLEMDVWGNVPHAKYFQVGKAITSSVTKPTSFRICYDSKYLYLAAKMWEPAPDLIKEGSRVQDGWPITDRINFIFSKEYARKGTYQDSPYMFLMFGAGGIHRGFYNDVKKKIEIPFNEDAQEWTTAYSKDDLHWYIESKVPLKMLGIDPAKDKMVYLNVRRDCYTGSVPGAQSQWSATTSAQLAAHSFGTLHFLKNNPKVKGLQERINGRPRHWYFRGNIKPLMNRKGAYIGGKQAYGDLPGWQEAEKIVDKLKATHKIEKKKDNWTSADSIDDLYMQWQKVLRKLQRSAPSSDFKINTRNAKITSVTLNGNKITLKNGKYPFALISGLNKLEITAEATGANPGVKFALQSSPESANDFSAAAPGTKDKDFKPAAVKNGYLWQGNLKKIVFRQNLIWNRVYGNHPLSFIGPLVKEWGVSPKETMFFIHNIYNPKATGKCDYKLIVEAPEGFTRLNDIGIHPKYYRHYPSLNVKTQKITHKGKKYIRYTMQWPLPEKLYHRADVTAYIHYISFRNDGYKFKKGEKVDFRFRRVVDGDTSDIVNVIKVKELPPIKGGKLKKIFFPQYDNFMNGRVSREQFKGMVDNAFMAGLNSVTWAPDYVGNAGKPYSKERNYQMKQLQRSGSRHFVSAIFNLPLWGAGKNTHTHALLKKYKDLRATYCNNTGAKVPDWHNEFCLTNATGKYKKEFRAALKKDYQYMMANNGISKDFFFNDENYPQAVKWRHAWCFCNTCKADFRAMFKIPANVKLDDNTIITKYPVEWSKWWKRKQKNQLLGMVKGIINELGGKVWYYHNTHDHDGYRESKGKYDIVSIPIPGQTYPCGAIQASMDFGKRNGEKITGCHNSIGQMHTYWGTNTSAIKVFSSDGFYLYPKEAKLMFVRMAATMHQGALIECASLCSAGLLYYIGEATRMIAAYEDLFYDGVRADNLATCTGFKYPNMLVLKKGDERLVLLFNESLTKTVTGVLTNLKLKPGQKAQIWESGKPYVDAKSIRVTVKPQDVIAIHIK